MDGETISSKNEQHSEHAKHEEIPHHEHVHHAEPHKKENFLQKYLKYLIVVVFYLVVALIMFYPLTKNLNSVAPGTGADTYQNLWDIWWVKYAVFNLHTNVFYTNLLYWPIGASLASSTLAPLNGIIFAPFGAISTVFEYNVMFFIGFIISGLAMFILADYMTDNKYAALISGFVFTFSAFHIAQAYSHIHFIDIAFIPLFVYFLLKIIHEDMNYRSIRSYGNIIGMSASFALTTLLGNIEQTLMLSLAFVFLLIAYLFYKESRKRIISRKFIVAIVLFVVLAFLIGLWNFIPLINFATKSGGLSSINAENTVQSYELWSVQPLAFFVPSYVNGFFYNVVGSPSSPLFNSLYSADPVEKVGYIGYAVLALSLFAIYKNWRKMLPYAIGAILFALLALGPAFHLYSLYSHVPGLNVVREPGRFDLIVTLFFAILVAFGSKELFEHLSKQSSHKQSIPRIYAVLFIILLIMFVENNGMPLGSNLQLTTPIQIPKLYPQIANISGNFSILPLPTLPTLGTASPYLYPGEDTFYTSITKKPIVGGYVGRTQNVSSTLLLYNVPLAVESTSLVENGSAYYPSPVIENYTNQSIFTLYNYNTEFIILHKQAYTQQEYLGFSNYLLGVFGNPVYNDNTSIVFSTTSAINRTVFRSFIEYPILSEWEPVSILLDGTYQEFWAPVNYGGIAVYAPYQNISRARYSGTSYINTTVAFTAFSNVPQNLYIAEPTQTNSTQTIAKMNITNRPTGYRITVPLVSGAQGNELLFIYSSKNSPVLISNITISR